MRLLFRLVFHRSRMFRETNGMRGFYCAIAMVGTPRCGVRTAQGYRQAGITIRWLPSLESPLSFALYAEVHCPKQNKESGGETIQDHRAREGIASSIRPSTPAFGQECEEET